MSVLNDSLVEDDETVTVTLTAITGGDADISIDSANDDATVTITDDDSALVSIAATDPGVAEPADNGQFTVSMTNQSDTATVISYTVTGDATAGSDYTALSGSVTIPANTSSATIPVSVIDDSLVEDDETVTVKLATITSGHPDVSIDAANDDAAVTITDDDSALVSIAATDAAAAEPADNGQLTVSMTNQSDTATVISYTVSGDATAGSDYTALSGSVTIPANTSSATIPVSVLNDSLVEDDETVTVTLTAITGGDADISIDSANDDATVTITDDDSALVSIAATDPAAAEPADNGQLTVSMTNQSDTATVISYTVTGDATAGSDYTAFSGSMTIPANTSTATIDVSVIDDSLVEDDETVTVKLATITSGCTRTSPSILASEDDTVTISDDDHADFGDAPDAPYATLSANNGPSHVIVPSLYMGAAVDTEPDGQPTASADGDDLNGLLGADDEDGWSTRPAIGSARRRDSHGQVNVTNTTESAATLYGWIDYNGDGVFENATERASVAVPNGSSGATVTLVFPAVPWLSPAVTDTYARFRLSTDAAAANPTGAAGDGEVEDYTAHITYASIADRHVFYDGSYFDDGDDNNAVATDKEALLPGGTATFDNYISYARFRGGQWTATLNGIMIDIAELAGTVTAADFEFRTGNSHTPGGWVAATAPTSVTVHAGEGTGGSDRVKVIWAETAVANSHWLQVTVLANANTGLAAPDVFYFGLAAGESGNSTANTYVDATDFAGARDNPHNFLNRAAHRRRVRLQPRLVRRHLRPGDRSRQQYELPHRIEADRRAGGPDGARRRLS